MADVFDVANWFLHKEAMTPKKIQKLCYYYKAWGLALYDKDLIPDAKFEAWVHGPVCPKLYSKYKSYGWNDVPQIEQDNSDLFDEKEIDVLESVWLTYGEMSANALEAQTHVEDPWRTTREGFPDSQNCSKVISNNKMKKFYKAIYKEGQGD